MIENWYLACMILLTSPLNWHNAVTLTLTYFKVKFVAAWEIAILQICLLLYRKNVCLPFQLCFRYVNSRKSMAMCTVWPWMVNLALWFLTCWLVVWGSGSVILLRLKIGLAPQKYDVISMPRQQYTNTKHIPIESYHPVVSIKPRHMDPKKIFCQNLCCREVKIYKISGRDLPYFSLKCDNLP